jgi:hypothetical protein
LIILFLSVSDAFLTLLLIGNGAYEANPVMAYFLKFGPYIFFTVKYTLTSLGLIALLIYRNRISKAVKVSASALLYIFASIFFTVVVWQLYMVSKIMS